VKENDKVPEGGSLMAKAFTESLSNQATLLGGTFSAQPEKRIRRKRKREPAAGQTDLLTGKEYGDLAKQFRALQKVLSINGFLSKREKNISGFP